MIGKKAVCLTCRSSVEGRTQQEDASKISRVLKSFCAFRTYSSTRNSEVPVSERIVSGEAKIDLVTVAVSLSS